MSGAITNALGFRNRAKMHGDCIDVRGQREPHKAFDWSEPLELGYADKLYDTFYKEGFDHSWST